MKKLTILLILSLPIILGAESNSSRQLTETEQLRLQNLTLQSQLLKVAQEAYIKELCGSVGADPSKDCRLSNGEVSKIITPAPTSALTPPKITPLPYSQAKETAISSAKDPTKDPAKEKER